MCVMGVGCTINSSMTPDNFINVSYLTCGLLVGETVPSIQYWHRDPIPQKPTDSLRNFDRLLMWILISTTPIYIPKWWALLQPLFIHVDFKTVQMMPEASLYKLVLPTETLTDAQRYNMWSLRAVQLYANVSWHAPACSLFSVGYTAIMKGWADLCSDLASHKRSNVAGVSSKTRESCCLLPLDLNSPCSV